MKNKIKSKEINEILPVRNYSSERLEILTKDLQSLPVGFGTPFLISCGSQRVTLSTIDRVRRNLISQGAFRFGKLIKNGQNKFKGIIVHRIR